MLSSQRGLDKSKKKGKDHLKLFEKKMTQKFKKLEVTKSQMLKSQKAEEAKRLA